jgi:hypothetical protein
MSQQERQQKRALRWRIYSALLLLAVVAAGGAWWASAIQAAPLYLVVSGDTAGWITPCGCASNQSGGLARRGHHVETLRQRGQVIVADAGGAPGGTSAYHRVKFEAILQGELDMGLDAHNLGGPEAALGADYLREVAQRLRVPFLSANLRDKQGQPVAEGVRMITRGGKRVALVGVLSRRHAVAGVQIDDPREAVLQTIAGLRDQYDTLVVLAYLPEDELRQLAAELPEADAMIGGPTGQSIAPRQTGQALLAAATNKGKFVVELALTASQPRHSWTGQVVEMGPTLAHSPAQETNLRRYLAELDRRQFSAQESGLAPSTTSMPADFRLAGNQACIACHSQDCSHWDGTKHAHAWQTLLDKGFHVDSYCQQCHTTGFGMPGGFQSIARSTRLMGVGCESCHGPSAAHASNPRLRTPFLAKDQ